MLWSRTPHLAIASALTATTLAPDVAAHGGIPRGIAVHVDPTEPAHLAIQSDDWGVITSTDGAASFAWVCAQAWGEEAAGVRHPAMVLAAGGRLVVARGAAGLHVSSPDGCSWRSPAELSQYAARDVEQAPDGGEIWVLAASTGATGENALFRSFDGGETFVTLSTSLPEDVTVASVAVAWEGGPVLVAGVDTSAGGPVLLRASDAAGAWERQAIDPTAFAGGTLDVWIHPADPRLVLVRVDRPPSSPQVDDGVDALYGSIDGGETLSLWLEGAGGLTGLALSPDGQTLALAGPSVGLWTADVSTLLSTGGAALQERTRQPVWGLGWTAAGLYGGLDDFAESGERAWLGRWSEAARDFEPVTSICSVSPAACLDDSTFGMVCVDVFERLGGFEQAILEGPRCVAPRDAGAEGGAGASSEPSSGCACAAAGRPRERGWGGLLTVLAPLVVALRRQGAVQR